MKKLIISLISIFLLVSFIKADETENILLSENQDILVLDIPEIMHLASKQNLDIAIAGARTKQAKSYFVGSFASLAPSLKAQGYVEKFRGGEVFFGPIPRTSNRTTYRPALYADYQLNTGGKALFQIIASKQSLNRAHATEYNISQEVLLNALSNYFVWLRDNSKIEVAKQSLKEAEEQLQTINSRLKSGFSTQLDVDQSATLKYERENLLLEANNQKQITEMNLAIVLNMPIEKKLIPADTLLKPIDFWEDNLDLSQIFEIAGKERADLKALTYTIKEARARFASAITDLFPTVALSGYTRGIGPNLNELDRSKQGSISINIDILRNLGIDTMSNIIANKAKIQEAILTKEKQLNDMRSEIAKAYYNMQLGEDKLKVAVEKLKYTQEAYRISLSRQKAGIGINLETIHAQTKLTEAKLEYQEAVLQYNNSQIKLLYETGRLTPKQILLSINNL